MFGQTLKWTFEKLQFLALVYCLHFLKIWGVLDATVRCTLSCSIGFVGYMEKAAWCILWHCVLSNYEAEGLSLVGSTTAL